MVRMATHATSHPRPHPLASLVRPPSPQHSTEGNCIRVTLDGAFTDYNVGLGSCNQKIKGSILGSIMFFCSLFFVYFLFCMLCMLNYSLLQILIKYLITNNELVCHVTKKHDATEDRTLNLLVATS